ncbi:MAG: hypothetical protein WDA53_00155 [Bacillota bacterium]
MSINLLPKELKSSNKLFFNIPTYIRVVIFYGIFFMVSNGLLWLMVSRLEQEVMEKQLMNDKFVNIEIDLEGLHEQQKRNENQLTALKNILQSPSNTYESLKVIETILPQGLDLIEIAFKNTNNVFVLGKAVSLGLLEGFLIDLERHRYFEEVTLSELKNDPDTGLSSFKIKLLTKVENRVSPND